MNEWQLGSLMAGLTLGLTFGAGAVGLWAHKQRRAWHRFARRSEQARQQLLQQNSQARKQVEQVQARLNAARHQLAMQAAHATHPHFLEGVDRVNPSEPQGPVIGFMQTEMERSADGFASTQVVLRAH